MKLRTTSVIIKSISNFGYCSIVAGMNYYRTMNAMEYFIINYERKYGNK